MFNRYEKEKLYLAGPVCFYPRGYTLWDQRRRQAEYRGFGVSLPNDSKLELTHADIRRNADAIFGNCADSMAISTGIIADLELFRGSEPDGGTVFEIGMAYALGLRCYAFTRDLRPMRAKHQAACLQGDRVMDGFGWELPYADLPFCPSLVASCKIVEGDFGAALNTLATDIDEEAKQPKETSEKPPRGSATPRVRPMVYLAGPQRYAPDAESYYRRMKEICNAQGYDVVTPLDGEPIPSYSDPYATAAALAARWRQHVLDCDILLADLGDFHGWEPSSDVAFECGMAWQLGKKCVGMMPDIRNMQTRLPHYSTEKGGCDLAGNTVEDFNYPINLMFASSMPILEGSLEEVLPQLRF